jgi:glutathione S-transferase
MDHARAVFALADRRLGARANEAEWAMGSYSIVDIHLFRLFWRFWNAFKPPAQEFPNLSAHYTRMIARPAVMHTIEIETRVGYQLPM